MFLHWQNLGQIFVQKKLQMVDMQFVVKFSFTKVNFPIRTSFWLADTGRIVVVNSF